MKPLDPHRQHLLDALACDLIGPYDPQTGLEVLRLPPLRWYLTGFLVPVSAALTEANTLADEDEELDLGDEREADAELGTEPGNKQRPVLPSSIGLSVLLPMPEPGEPDQIAVELAWGEYVLRSTSDDVAALCRKRGMNPDKYLPSDKRKHPVEL